MYTNITMGVLAVRCPEGMDESNCQARKYLQEQTEFRQTTNETQLEPVGPWKQTCAAKVAVICRLNDICQKCMGND